MFWIFSRHDSFLQTTVTRVTINMTKLYYNRHNTKKKYMKMNFVRFT